MAPHSSPADFETPAGVVDLERVRANVERVIGYCDAHGISWRPHVKTHKSTRLARLQLQAGARGLTVATPREAEVMASVCDDLLLAYPVIGRSKLDRVMALPPHVGLTVGLDSEAALGAVARAARRARRTVRILVEADLGMRRVGLQGPEEVVGLAGRARDLEGVEYAGLMFYPGHIRSRGRGQDTDLGALASDLAKLYEALRAAGLGPEVVSGGSTPTLWRSHELPGLTEIRSGTAVFFDREGISTGVAEARHMAYTVHATVVSTSVRGQAVVDAGSKALSKEEDGEHGFAVLLDHPEVVVKALSEEHGVLDLGRTRWRPTVGERVRVLPNHVCVSVNLQDELLVLAGGGALERWPLEARGRGRFAASGLRSGAGQGP